ncbi:MAG: Holliday junction resolvase RuvX [Anaerolineales bacterium]|nr:Holliday junction resolvase RuvX [Anaerolineales bacterium]
MLTTKPTSQQTNQLTNQRTTMTQNDFTIKGRVLALDLGEKRIGVAVSDATRTIATTLDVIKRTSRQADFAQIGRLLAEQQANLLVIGLPVMLDGREGEKAAWVRDYAAALYNELQVPIAFTDEAFTTVQAENSLRARGQKGRKIRQNVDAVAATLILQAYLDAQDNNQQMTGSA